MIGPALGAAPVPTAVLVRLVGAFAVFREGAPGPVRLGSRKARRLLAVLAVQRDRLVPTERLVEALWPEVTPRRPVADLATLVSRLRAEFGPDVVHGERGGYRLGAPPLVRVDLDEAATLVAECAGSGPDAVAAGRAALGLLAAGAVLVDEPDADWVREARARYDRLLRDARHATAAAALRADDPAAARELAAAAVGADPLDEPAHRLLMAAHQAAGEPARALLAYQRLRELLAAELGVDPAPATRALHEAVLAERDAPGAAPASGRPPGPPLIGRAAEVRRLRGAWDGARTGRARLVLIAGEGGIGKSRLAADVAAAARHAGGLVLETRCYASERSLFLQPVVEVLGPALAALPEPRLRAAAGSRAAALAGLIPELAGPLGITEVDRSRPDVELRRVFEAVLGVLRALAAQRPVLLLLDDLHNAGLATVELLHFLARQLGPAGLLALATVRADEGREALDALADVSERLDLGPLDGAAVARLAADAGHPGLAEGIMRRTRGHPLFVVESLRAAAAGEPGVPETLQAAVLARLRAVGAPTEEVLRAGAVLGAAIDPEPVAAVLEISSLEVTRRCAQAVAARLLVVTERSFEFANDVVAEVVYATTAAPVRLAYHRRAADALSATPEAVAGHAAVLRDWPRAAKAYLLAGERALTGLAMSDAQVLFGRALAAAERAGDRELVGRARLARSAAREALAQYQDAVDDLQAALESARAAGDRRLEMVVLHALGGHAATVVGVPIERCEGWLRDSLGIARSLGDRGVEARVMGWLAVLGTHRLRFGPAVALADRAVAVARTAGADQPLAEALDGLKTGYAYLGDTGPLQGVLDELVPLLRRLGDSFRLQWAVFESAFDPWRRADWAGAERTVATAVELAQRSGHPVHESWYVAHLGWMVRQQGRLDEAQRLGRRAVELAGRFGHGWFRSAAAGLLARTLLAAGDRAGAEAVLLGTSGVDDGSAAEGHRLRRLAPLAEVTGGWAELRAADGLLAAVAAPPGQAWLLGADCYLAVAQAWLARGEPATARAVLAPLLAAAERQGWVPVRVTAGVVDARAALLLGEPAAGAAAEAVALLATRHGMAEALGHPTGTP